MPRPKKDYIRTHIHVSTDLFAELQLYLMDPTKGSLRHGALSGLIDNLLRKWLEALRKPDVDTVKFLAAYGIEIEHKKGVDQHD